ncbi:MAG: thioredoxin family protein [Pseudomonadota bacterium]
MRPRPDTIAGAVRCGINAARRIIEALRSDPRPRSLPSIPRTGSPRIRVCCEWSPLSAGTGPLDRKAADINEIVGFGVMMTPALAVDGLVKVTGKVPSVDEIRDIIVKS